MYAGTCIFLWLIHAQDFDKDSEVSHVDRKERNEGMSFPRKIWSSISFFGSSSPASSSSSKSFCYRITRCPRSSSRQVLIVLGCFTLQMALTAFLWNRYVEQYQLLLETPPTSAIYAVGYFCYFWNTITFLSCFSNFISQARQNKVFHSSITWVILWFWRVLCGHSLTNMLLMSVLLNKIWDFLRGIQWIGFIALITVAIFTEMHINEVIDRLPLKLTFFNEFL